MLLIFFNRAFALHPSEIVCFSSAGYLKFSFCAGTGFFFSISTVVSYKHNFKNQCEKLKLRPFRVSTLSAGLHVPQNGSFFKPVYFKKMGFLVELF